MRTTLTTALLLTLALPATLPAEVVLRPLDLTAAELPILRQAHTPAPPAEKVDERQQALFVPFYEVDATDPAGTTTLYAVRNVSSQPVDIEIRYQAPDGTALRGDVMTLAGRATLTRNLRDIGGLPVDPGGFARGFIVILQTSRLTAPYLVGDYIQVDVGNSFATAQRMASPDDLCGLTEARFLDFGAGTELRLMIAQPQGPNPVSDPASVIVTPITEDGTLLPQTEIYTNQFAVRVSASDFTGSAFGTLVFDFQNSGGGLVYAEYSAGGRFSVGLNGACLTPAP
jgi:hypothetical protein